MIAQTDLQHTPQVVDPWTNFPFLKNTATRLMVSKSNRASLEKDMVSFEKSCFERATKLAAGAESNKPWLEQYNAFGKRVDEIHVSSEWNSLKAIASKEGIAGIPFESTSSDGRVHWAAKHLIFSPVSGLYSCPLAMTDGAARCISDLLNPPNGDLCDYPPEVMKRLGDTVKRLTSRDPGSFWSSGQWMTEYHGGSDVGGGTITLASPLSDFTDAALSEGGFFTHRLTGFKWFTSATDADVSLVLAREFDATGKPIPGSKGLSLFYVELRDPVTRQLKPSIQVVRLKEKLGTKQMPTAELVLAGLPARRLSPIGRGVATIATMLNVTRLHNSIAAVGFMWRGLALAQDYALHRSTLGHLVARHPLQREVLEAMEVDVRAAVAATMTLAKFCGMSENKGEGVRQFPGEPEGGEGKVAASLYRTLIPVLKLWTAKIAVRQAQETLEAWGGIGYIEQSGMPNLVRDVNVLPVWEGTTNVLSCDLLRALMHGESAAKKTNQPSPAELLFKHANQVISTLKTANSSFVSPISENVIATLEKAVNEIRDLMTLVLRQVGADLHANKSLPPAGQAAARILAFAVGDLFGALCLAEHATWTRAAEDSDVFSRFVLGDSLWRAQRPLVDVAAAKRAVARRVADVKGEQSLQITGYIPKGLAAKL